MPWPTKRFDRPAPRLPSRIRPGRMRSSSSRVAMRSLDSLARGDGAETVEFPDLSAPSAGKAFGRKSENLNPTNHMRATSVGAFILPSGGRFPAHAMLCRQTCDRARQSAMDRMHAHCVTFRSETAINRPVDRGAKPVKSATRATAEERSYCIANDGPFAAEDRSACSTKSGASAHDGVPDSTITCASAPPPDVNGPSAPRASRRAVVGRSRGRPR
jgi:hypothetical protein